MARSAKQAAAIERELVKLTKLTRKDDEGQEAWIKRLVIAALRDEDIVDALEDGTYDFCTARADAIEAKAEILDFNDKEIEEEEPEDEDEESEEDEDEEEPEEEEEEAPKPKSKGDKDKKEEKPRSTGLVKSPATGKEVTMTEACQHLALMHTDMLDDRQGLIALAEKELNAPQNTVSSALYHMKGAIAGVKEVFGIDLMKKDPKSTSGSSKNSKKKTRTTRKPAEKKTEKPKRQRRTVKS